MHNLQTVLHLIDSAGLYGAERVVLELMSGQKKLGIEPVLFSAGDSPEPKAIEIEASKLGIDVIVWRGKAGLNPRLLKAVQELSVSGRFQIMHSHGYKFNILLAILKWFSNSCVVVTTVHGYVNAPRFSKMAIYESLDRFFIPQLDGVALVSETMKAVMNNSDTCSVISNGFSGLPSEGQVRADVKIFLNGAKKKICCVGRLSAEKGHGNLLSALAQLDNSSIKLVIYGDGPLKSKLIEQANELGIKNQLMLAGYCGEIESQLPYFDLFVMPSITEGLPIALLEAIRAQLPIVATAVGSVPYVLGSNYVGLCEKSSEQLADSIKQQLSNPPNFDARNRLKQVTEEKFGSEKMVKNYLSFYQGVIIHAG